MPDWYGTSDPACPPEDGDAGDSAEWTRERHRRRIQAQRRRAKLELEQARRRLPSDPVKSEAHARQALQLGAQSYWLAELTDLAEREHRTLHQMGRWTRQTYGCALTLEDGNYSDRCPVSIADVRIGFSPGFVVRKKCSICDADLADCPHRRGRLYWVRGTKHADGHCRVCYRNDCTHRDDRVYRTTLIAIVHHIEKVHEVSLVDVPANPFARMTERPVSNADLAKTLGSRFVPGVEVSCDRCLSPYPGLPRASQPLGEPTTPHASS